MNQLTRVILGTALASLATIGGVSGAFTQSLSSTVNTNSNPVIIQYSPGGRIDQFEGELRQIAARGQQVIVNGECTSACTMVLGIIPRDRLCATDRANFGFHQAFSPTMWGKQPNAQGTRQMSQYWPRYV